MQKPVEFDLLFSFPCCFTIFYQWNAYSLK